MEHLLADTATRVTRNTSEKVNWQRRHQTQADIMHCALEPEDIDERLRELDYEWDIERTLEINFATVALTGSLLGGLVSKKWLWLTGVAAGFMVMHTTQGWCPPLPIFRRMGIRTQREIESERCALKALRGDLDEVVHADDAQTKARRAIEAVDA